MILSAFIWFTLAIVFLAGTNRVNIFSLGYLIGAFIFLWQGNDLYLRPVKVILRWWSFLIRYSVTVILIKAMLQILGCIFLREMQDHACWAVQLFGGAELIEELSHKQIQEQLEAERKILEKIKYKMGQDQSIAAESTGAKLQGAEQPF
ncbi:piezo-type mechanosensitive ion channel component-like [Homalodisca vitripennis]|uniref:piezo-type mechanosensitive ion channel component-like n=1 Tax=Homalodisca vitripennis TaxID=197043 RepID=UPI001EECB468|nr:piezo-type mechanosensitive ion channel component-like [Homalodisca vitripennis]